ncbi:KTSC domain-containing protein [Mesorhizobium atlanticum]
MPAMPSTAIQNIQYDPSRRVLSVWFVPSGNRYDYEDVEPETYTAFKAAFSKGQFFNEFVRDRFRYRLVGRGRRQ